MERLIITDVTYPPEVKIMNGKALVFKTEIKDFEKEAHKVIDTFNDLSIFDKLKVKRAMKLFNAQEITIEENI